MSLIDYGLIAFKNGVPIKGEWKIGAGATFELDNVVYIDSLWVFSSLTSSPVYNYDSMEGTKVHRYELNGVQFKTKEYYPYLMLTQFKVGNDFYDIIHGVDVDTRVVMSKARLKELNKLLRRVARVPLDFTPKYYKPAWRRY